MAHGNLPSASSSSYARNNSYVYDVFLNHRGPDCKETFATDLYNCLRRYGLGVFLDKEELQKGDRLDSQIEGAILKAAVHVAIFSKTYAKSSWCLNELVLMLRSGATILPIFYGGVKPSHLRWVEGNPAGPYAQDLHDLERQTTNGKPRYHQDTVKEWGRALSQAAGISGFELEKYESEQHPIFPQIVKEVLKNVKKPVYVAEHPVGLDRKVEDFQRVMSLQQPSSETSETRETRVIGIVGLGGVGKTTLAREIFNRFLSTYDRYCFLSDISGKSLVSSQIVLLRDLARCSEEIRDIDDGKQKIIRYLSPPSSDGTEKKIFPPALIIVDNVDLIEQLNALQLVTVKANIGEGSLMLITSRNRDVLKSSGLVAESSIYELRGLDTRHSQELFCWHAFHQPNPVAVFEPVVEKFLEVCLGLPLTLQVIGASLAGQDELRYWEAAWGKIISKGLPRDIIGRLKISYDGLDDEEKQIFLDVACFFIGEDCDTAITICDGSGWNGWLGFRKLQNRCLMEVDSKNRITMHDHVRDLGREIGEKEPPHRLWRPTDNLQYDLSIKEFPVRGIDMAHRHGYKWPHPQLFESLAKLQNSRFLFNMSQLQLLRAEGNYVESILSVLQSPQQVCPPPQLVWLSCRSCPFTSLPSSLPLNKLRVLELKDFSKLETPWQDDYQAPPELRKLVLMGCSNLRSLPDSFENLTKLEHIDLSRCSNLLRLPNYFWKLQNLKLLDLDGCSSLRGFPPRRWKLKSSEF